MELYFCAHFDHFDHGRDGTTSMGVKGMMMDRRDLNSYHWCSDPPHHRHYGPAVENMRYISGVFKVN